jgi:hypothetical protein
MTDVYGQLLDSVGLLSVEEARAVIDAYLLVRQMPARIRMLQLKNPEHQALDSGFVHVDSSYFNELRDYIRDILKKWSSRLEHFQHPKRALVPTATKHSADFSHFARRPQKTRAPL